MAGLLIFGLKLGLLASFGMAIAAVILAVLLRWFFRTWTVEKLAVVSSAIGPLSVALFMVVLVADVMYGSLRVSGPEAQGLTILGIAAIVAFGLGWLLGRWAVFFVFKRAAAK